MHAALHPHADSPIDRNQRILIIDDNAAIHDDVRKILGAPSQADTDLDDEAAELFGLAPESPASSAFEIDSAFQGQEGLAKVQHALDEGRPYAMAFVDVRMPPGWDGIETISRIWKTYPELQVVICTAYSDYSWEEMIRKVGRTDSLVVLKKPFDNVEVLQLAHTLTRKWTLSNRLQHHLEGLDKLVATRTHELQAANDRLRLEMDERATAEKELQRSEQRFAKAFQASPIPMAIQSLSTDRFIDVNEAFLAMTGYRRLEIISRSPLELDLCVDAEIPILLRLQLNDAGTVRNLETELRARAGEIKECVISAEAVELGEEKVALVATLDVSEQRKLEKQLRHSQKLEAVGQFAAGVAHDFNNMLAIIQGHASIHLAAKNLEQGVAESLQQVSDAAERAATLTRQLLTFSRKQVVQPEVLDVHRVITNLYGMLCRLIGPGIELRSELAPGVPPVFADQSNFEQIIVNLVLNARDAMPDGGELVIRAEEMLLDEAGTARHPQAREGDFVLIAVRDTGCGMDAETLSHIFEPFFTTKEVGKGTGLGLATVYGIVAHQGGWIEVSSEVGRGTEMRVFLPASEHRQSSSNRAEDGDLRGGDETVFVVEDEAAIREIMADILREYGYHVIEACDGSEAMNIWEKRKDEIDILVTDIVMPNGPKGNVIAERFVAERPDLKVIFSSGYSSEYATESSPLDERFDFLEKPYKPELLIRTVRACLDRQK